MPDTHDTAKIQSEDSRAEAKAAAASASLGPRPVDHKSLTREIIARFPKILAALAK